MREILFKAKRLDNGKWVEGLLCKGLFSKFAIEETKEERRRDIDPGTVCQFTGLVDKNGNRIWEHDKIICKQWIGGNWIDYTTEIGYVEMKFGSFGLHRKFGDVDAYYRPFKDWLEDYEFEVIGNIHDDED